MTMKIEFKNISSLKKVFPDEKLKSLSYDKDSALLGETFSYQVAYYTETPLVDIEVEINSPLASNIRVRQVECAPVRYAGYIFDDDVLRKTPGMYPDILQEIGKFPLRSVAHVWRALWITVSIPEDHQGGKIPIEVILNCCDRFDNKEQYVSTFELEIIPLVLPQQKLIHTEWFHVDCLSTYYNAEIWSDELWEIIENYIKNAVAHGINMLLTPLFTPPLDTKIGGERPTVQLVDVYKDEAGYRFDFAQLKRWVDLGRKVGIEYFEFSHFFTQWGGEKTPKIIAEINGEKEQIFGWKIDSDSAEYIKFIDSFLPKLVEWITEEGLDNQVYFHVSDEPELENLEHYKKLVSILKRHLADFKMFDALSNPEFYREAVVETPVVSVDHIDEFLDNRPDDLWAYYCCGQTSEVSNRFLHFPSARNRILGILLYLYDVKGFLQWGLNFWYARFSLFPVNPWSVLDANYGFPPGDAFQVYPGEDGKPVDSIHYEVFYGGLQDMRALKLLEQKVSREEICSMLEKHYGQKITMHSYPRGEKNMLSLRTLINECLKKAYLKTL